MAKEKQPKILEKDISKAIRKTLNQLGIFHWKVWQGMGSKPGVSDILGVLPDGRILAIEVKTPLGMNKRLRDRAKGLDIPQDIFIDRVKQNGGVAFYATSAFEVYEAIQWALKRSKVQDE